MLLWMVLSASAETTTGISPVPDYKDQSAKILADYTSQMQAFSKLFAEPALNDPAWQKQVQTVSAGVKEQAQRLRDLPAPRSACFDALSKRIATATRQMNEAMDALAAATIVELARAVPKLDAANAGMGAVIQEMQSGLCSYKTKNGDTTWSAPSS